MDLSPHRLAWIAPILLAAAAALLSAEDPPTTPPAAVWMGRLADRDPAIREDALRRLAALGAEAAAAASAVAAALDDEYPGVRAAAQAALLHLGPRAATAAPTLIGLLRSPVAERRQAAAGLLARIGPTDAGAIPALLEAARAAEPHRSRDFLTALGAQGPAGVDALLHLAAETAPLPLRRAALEAIPTGSGAAAATLIALLDDPAPELREGAALALQRVAAEPAATARALLAAIRKGDPPRADAFVAGLVRLGSEGMTALERLAAGRGEYGKAARRAAIDTLAARKPRPDGLPRLLRDCLYDPEREIREGAAATLGKMGADVGGYAPDLVKVALDPANDRPQVFLTALAGLGPHGTAAVRAIYDSPAIRGRGTRGWALYLLARDLPRSAELLHLLVASLRDDEPEVREQAAHCINAFGPTAESAIPALIEALDDPRNDSPEPFLSPLRRMGEGGRAALLRLLTGPPRPHRVIRLAALDGILAMAPRSRDSLETLLGCLTDEDDALRERAIRSIVGFGKEAREAIPLLVAAAKRPDRGRLADLLQALRSLGPDAVPALLDLAGDSASADEELPAEALRVWLATNPPPEKVVPVLVGALGERCTRRRHAALASLAQIHPPVEALNRLEQVLRAPAHCRSATSADLCFGVHLPDEVVPSWCQRAAARALARIGPAGLGVLRRVALDPDPKVAVATVEQLGEQAPGAVEAAGAVTDALRHADPRVRVKALATIPTLRPPPPAALPAVLEALAAPDSALPALTALSAYGPAARVAVPVLEAFLETDPGRSHRARVLDVLRAIGPR